MALGRARLRYDRQQHQRCRQRDDKHSHDLAPSEGAIHDTRTAQDFAQQLRQLGDVRCDPSRLILTEQLGGRASASWGRSLALSKIQS
jgi:hypothetical protein